MATSIPAEEHALTREMTWGGGSGSRDGPLSVGLVPNNETFREQWTEQIYTIRGNDARLVYAYEAVRKECTPVDLPPGDFRAAFVLSRQCVNMNPYLGQTWITEPEADTLWQGDAGEGKYTISLAHNNAGVLKSIRIAISRAEGNDRTLLMVGHCLLCMLDWLVKQLEDKNLPASHYMDPHFNHLEDADVKAEAECALGVPADEIRICTGCGKKIHYVEEYITVSLPRDSDTNRGPIKWKHLLLAPRGPSVDRAGAATLVRNVRDGVEKDQDLFSTHKYGQVYTVHIQELRDDMSPMGKKASKLDKVTVPSEAPLIEPEGMTVPLQSARITVNILAFVIAVAVSVPYSGLEIGDQATFSVNTAMLAVTIWIALYATLPPMFYPGSTLHDFNEGNFTSKRLDQVIHALQPWWIIQLFKISMLKTMQERRTKQFVYQSARLAAMKGQARIEGPSSRLFPANDNPSAPELRLRENPPLALLAGKGTFTMIEVFKGAGQPEDVTLLSAISFRGENCQFTVVPTRTHGWTVVGGSGQVRFPAKAGAILGQILGNIEGLTDPGELRFWSTYSENASPINVPLLTSYRMKLRDRFILGVNKYWHGDRSGAANTDLNTKIDFWDFRAKIAEDYVAFYETGQMPDIPDHPDFWKKMA